MNKAEFRESISQSNQKIDFGYYETLYIERSLEPLRDLILNSEIHTIIGFVPFSSEPPITELMRRLNALCSERPLQLGLVRIERDFALSVRLWDGEESSFEVSSLKKIRQVGMNPLIEDLAQSLIFVPGLAFSKNGDRIGRGMGYYDRFLKRASASYAGIIKVGVSFARNIVSSIPTENHDERMDYVVTENEIYRCQSKV